ncbi:MAG: hypothetical protein EKK55_12460 [Rhodocyclaceae bacterium]|nr:MAG: hypothetical protein EKK55_12460 [Rhodocyclaceae bacterium]
MTHDDQPSEVMVPEDLDEPREVRQTTKHLGRFMRAARHVADNAAVVFRPVKFPHGGATVATFDSSLDITIVMMNCARTA